MTSMAPPYGSDVAGLERQLSMRTGQHVVCTNTGTAALHVALHLSGVGPGMRVALPSLSFIATANAISYLGATPVFCACKDDLTLDPAYVPDDVDFVVPVSLGGHPCETPYPHDRCVEDAAGAFGSTSTAETRIWSFNNNKTITCGQGGAIVTDSPVLAEEARRAINTYRDGDYHSDIGWNYRMADVNARLLRWELDYVDVTIGAQRHDHVIYSRALAGRDDMRMLPLPNGANGWALFLEADDSVGLRQYLASHYIETRRLYVPLFLQPPYQGCETSGPVRQDCIRHERTIMLPHQHVRMVAERIAAWRL